MPKPIHTTDATFEADVLQADIPVLVDYWAEWCRPCHMMAPLVDELAETLEGQVRVVKLDVQANPETPTKLAIMQIPTLVIYVNGDEKKRMVGAVSRRKLVKELQQALD